MRDLIDLRAITGVHQAPFWISLEDLASRWTAMFAIFIRYMYYRGGAG